MSSTFAASCLIVSRHPACVAFIKEAAGLPENVEVLATARGCDVENRIVYGNVPMHLAAAAEAVVAVEFAGDAPRGAEYTLEEMKAAGAYLRTYTVSTPKLVHTWEMEAGCGDAVLFENGKIVW